MVGELILGAERGSHTEPVAAVAGWLGVSERTVRQARQRAAALGLLRVSERFRRRGRCRGRQLASAVGPGRRLPNGSGWSPLLTGSALLGVLAAARAERSAPVWAVVLAWVTGERDSHWASYSEGAGYAIARAVRAAGIHSAEARKAFFFGCSRPR